MIDRVRLAKLLGMTGSDGDGEALNAARLANRLVREAGMSWHQVIDVDPEIDIVDLVDLCLSNGATHLTAWELKFLASIRNNGSLSPKQKRVLNKLVNKCSK